MKKIFLLAALTLSLTACDQNDENIVPASEAAKITASIGENRLSRATDTKWAENDEIGITVTITDGSTKYVNLLYSTPKADGNFEGETPIYFYKNSSAIAYYPFTGTEGTAPEIVKAETTADFQKEEMQPKIDFLFAESTPLNVSGNRPEFNFSFAHKMSKLTFKFVNGNDGTDVSKIVSYKIDGLVMNGTFNPADGTAKADETEAAPLTMTVSDVKDVSPLILFPQKAGKDTVKLTIYADELNSEEFIHNYICTLNFDGEELKPGVHYLYTIKVTKKEISVNQSTITDWTTETGTFEGESE